MAKDNMLQEALEAIRQGHRSRARGLFTRLLRTNKSNVDYWLGMSSVVDSTKEQIYCVKKALEIKPDNDVALRALVLLGGQPPDENLKPVKPDRQREWKLGKISRTGKTDRVKQRAPIQVSRLLTFGGLAVVAFGLIYFGIFNNPLPGSRSTGGVGLTRVPLGSGGATPTFIGDTGASGPTPFATFPGPTPLSLLLDAPYTATPRYVNTPHPSTAAYRSAMNAFDQGNWETAIVFLEQAIKIDPGGADLYYHLGIAYLMIEEYFDAKAEFINAANVDPTFGSAYLGMALADLGLGLEGDLVDELNSAVQNDPNLGEAYVQRGIFRFSRGNTDGAWADFLRAEEQSPNSASLYINLANVYLVLEQHDDALYAAQRAYEIDITVVEIYWVLAQVYHALRQTRDVIGPLVTYLSFEEENADAWFILGRAFIAERSYDDALIALEKALEIEDTLGEVNYYRGLAYLELKDYANALKYLGNSAGNFPTWFEPNLTLGRALFESGETADAYDQINKSSAFAKTSQQIVLQLYWEALALEGLGEMEIALLRWGTLLTYSTDVVPREWEALARSRLVDAGITFPSRTPPAPTPTPTITPTPTSMPTASPTP